MKNNFTHKLILILFLGLIIFGFILIGLLQQPVKKQIKSSISVYQHPNMHSLLVTKVTNTDPIVGIYQKGAWIEVANTSNGMVGWMRYPDFSHIINPSKSLLLTSANVKKKIQLDRFSQQALELQQQLNTELRTQPDPEAIKKMNASYESQLLLIQKMIKNMQADLKNYQ